MHQSPTPTRRNRWRLVATVASLVLAGALAGSVASALPPYTVHARVAPTPVAVGSAFRVTADGSSSNASILVVFLDLRACATTASEERSLGATEIIYHSVVGLYKRFRTVTAHTAGDHFACAYLIGTPPQSLTRAYAFRPYTVTP